tara:strand:- start:670 stop:1251 length:582 start_codon:yes stop_codon:yes gene_type:complete
MRMVKTSGFKKAIAPNPEVPPFPRTLPYATPKVPKSMDDQVHAKGMWVVSRTNAARGLAENVNSSIKYLEDGNIELRNDHFTKGSPHRGEDELSQIDYDVRLMTASLKDGLRIFEEHSDPNHPPEHEENPFDIGLYSVLEDQLMHLAGDYKRANDKDPGLGPFVYSPQGGYLRGRLYVIDSYFNAYYGPTFTS